MPEAPIPAARSALEQAGMTIERMDAVKTHNPFAVNDVLFSRQTGVPLERMNNYGCSLVWGHPQGPTGLRAIIELIEELEMRGGGYGLFHGCAAGDSAMAVVVQVTDAKKN
jgi:acetyl-CoA acetyltransferase